MVPQVSQAAKQNRASRFVNSPVELRLRVGARLWRMRDATYKSPVLVSEFHYDLPAERIAEEPLADRAGSRMLHLNRRARAWTDGRVRQDRCMLPERQCLSV